jgi:lipopolysaccharide/colanic/teichoic acid biosynthesis glycosyltransferase
MDAKKILIINPSDFYNFIISHTSIFHGMQVSVFNCKIDSHFLDINYSHFSSFDFVYIDDFLNSFDYIQLSDQLKRSHYKKNKIFSLVNTYENIFQKSAFIRSENKTLFPEYLNHLEESKLINTLLRFADIFFVIFLSPVVIFTLIVAIFLLKVFNPGPFIFKQMRVGKNSKPFAIYKLRTMYVTTNLVFTTLNDDRIFPLGRIFRKLKVDELPQFYNILKGDMSFIGPRPERVDIFDSICKETPFFAKRLIVRPGLTGWAQVNNPVATPNESIEKLQFDVYYIKYISIKLLCKIFFFTIGIILRKKSL